MLVQVGEGGKIQKDIGWVERMEVGKRGGRCVNGIVLQFENA